MPDTTDPRAVADYRIEARQLKAGDIVNTSPGGPDDWQKVLAVHTKSSSSDSDIASLMRTIGDRYVLVELSDVNAVDSNVYIESGTAMLFGSDDDDDQPLADHVGDPADKRLYVYTVYELVTLRA